MKRLLLLGGGHSHVEVIRRFATAPPPGTATFLVSPDRYTAYSGMLPGFVAGHYAFHECHIDLAALCRSAAIDRHASYATGIDPVARRVLCADGSAFTYDVLSLDIGSTPPAADIPGALDHAIPVRPVAAFVAAWDRIRVQAATEGPAPNFAVVGGGAAAVELVLSLHHRLQGNRGRAPRFHLLADTPSILPGFPARARRILERILHERGIAVHLNSRVVRIDAGTLIRQPPGQPFAAEHAIIVTGAAAPAWIGAGGLATDARGFVAVNPSLQSISHPEIFAAGDIASMVGFPRPKSGVYAVRQGSPLSENLRRALAGTSLTRYAPQKLALALISTGDRRAVAAWGPFALEGRWIWRWKDRIDRRFMAKYRSAGSEQP